MSHRLIAISLESETDIVLVRKRTRQIAELVGFEAQDQTRITTAVSEIARNAFEYGGGGRIEFSLSGKRPDSLEIVVSDEGPGIAELDRILAGMHRSATGMGIGLTGARRLVDGFAVESRPGAGTTVRLLKHMPPRIRLGAAELRRIAEALARSEPVSASDEIGRQNRDMLRQLDELQRRQEELERLNQELQDTNRGVVALYAELDERADHLRRADELKSRFLSNMSHEFRTPLNSIMALARLLLDRHGGPLTSEQERQVQFVAKAAATLTDLVDDLLDLAKVAAGKVVIAPAAFTAADLFGALRGMLRPLLVGDALALIFDDPSDLPPLFTDEGKVSQILRNLISNALKFTERGEVRVWASAGADDTITFCVRDTGIGIAPDDLEVIFEEFGQVDSALQRHVKGTGLGLPLSQKLAELLGGHITVQSAPGQGSLFSLTVPRTHLQLQSDIGEQDWTPQPGLVPVLCVEDDAADLFAIERAFAGTRYQFLPARSLAQAQQAVDRLRPAAILLDIVMLGQEAWHFLLAQKHDEATADIPILVSSSTGDSRKALHLGADEYLSKPIDAAKLIASLDRVTGHGSVTRVLLVDDEEITRYLVRQLLPRGRFALTETATAIEGLAEIGRAPPDILILDLNMPGMNGFEMLERLRRDQPARDLPAVVLTSAVLEDRDRQRLSGACAILSKSDLSAARLIESIERALRPAMDRQEARS
jgi:signal transduction histidine kinase/DNA-binding response OmpR family regulator